MNFLAFTKQRETVCDMQKFCITNGVPLSIKLDPNLILRTPQASTSLLWRALFPPVQPTTFWAKAFSTLCEETFTIEANVMTRMLLIPALIASKGNIANPGSAIVACNVMHTYSEKICSAGRQNIIVGTSFSETKAVNDFSNTWT